MKKTRYSFRHIESNLYDIYNYYSQVALSVRAFGVKAMVVDKHRTVMMSKQTTQIDRFDHYDDAWRTHDGDVIPWWIVKTGPGEDRVQPEICQVLDEIAQHHQNYLAKLITE